MSVPLDRLYNFLYDIANRNDLIIYGFYPHGSRKLDDLRCLQQRSLIPWVKAMTSPHLIFHDQEPLNYNLYTKKDFKDYLDIHGEYYPSENPKNLVAGMHLRACMKLPLMVYDQVLLCHSEKNSPELELYEQHGFVGVYYWSHALIAREWYRFANVDPKLTPNFDTITHDFLIYNRAWSGTREYRLTLVELLADHNLLSYCKTKFSEFDDQIRYTQHKFNNSDLAISRDDLHTIFPDNSHDATASADYDQEDYASSAIEVVLETLFDDSRHHLTEKTLRPIACGRPFILVATVGSLKYLQHYGFKTFNGLIDESYDLIVDPRQRLEAIAQEMKRISSLDHDAKKKLWAKLYAVAKQNKELFFSNKWQNSIIKEFCNNFTLGINQLTATGKYQQEIERIALDDPALAAYRARDIPLATHGPTIECRKKIKSWIEKNSPT